MTAKKPRRSSVPARRRKALSVPEGLAVTLPPATTEPASWPVPVAITVMIAGFVLTLAQASLQTALPKWNAFWNSSLVPAGASLKFIFVLDAGRMPGLYLELLGLCLLVWAFWGRRAGKSSWLDKAATGAEFALSFLLLHFLAAYLVLAWRRIGYPYELEFMEGTQVDMVMRVLRGQSLYTEPTMDFVGPVYPPLYSYLGALLSKFIGVGLPQLRYISLASVIGTFTLLYLWLRRETGQILPGLIAAGLFAGCFAFSGYWYDLARVDSLSVFTTLLGAYFLRFARTRRGFILAAVALSVATLVKSSAAVLILFLMIYLFFSDRAGLKIFSLTGAVIGVLSGLALHISSQGWSTYYLFKLPQTWARKVPGGVSLFDHLKGDLLPGMLVALAGLVALWAVKTERKRALFYSLFFAGALYTVYKGLTIQGAWLNHFILLHAPLALLVGLAFHAARAISWGGGLRLALGALLLVQGGRCLYDPQRALPDGSARFGWDKLIEDIKKVKGDVLMPFHGYLPSLAGKKPTAFVLYADAVTLSPKPGDLAPRNLQLDMVKRIREKTFDVLIMDGYGWTAMSSTIDAYYDGVDYPGMRAPVTGWQVAPNKWYTPKPEPKKP